MPNDYSHIYDLIDEDSLSLAKQICNKEVITLGEYSDQIDSNQKQQLYEIGYFVCAGLYLAYKQGLYPEREEIRDYIINNKLKEFNDPPINKLLSDYNIKFQVSDFMVLGIQQARKEMST